MLESVTKIEFVEAATGNNRGLGVQIRYEGQTEWETVFDSALDGTYYYDAGNTKYKDTQGHLVSISIPEGKQKNVSVRFYNLNASQYAFLPKSGYLRRLCFYGGTSDFDGRN